MKRRPGVETLGALFVALAAVLFGGTVILGKLLANRDYPVTSMLAIRFGIGATLLAGTLALLRQPLSPASGETRGLIALGAVGYAAESALFFLALGHGTASAVTLLFFTYPALVAVYSAVLGLGVPGWLTIGSLIAAVAGAALVVGASGGLAVSGAGVAFALGSALTFSLYLIGAEVVLQRTSSLAASMWVSASASLALAALALLGGDGRLPSGPREWWPIVGMGAFTAAAFSSLFIGLRRLGAVRTSIIAALEPVAAAALAFVFLDEPLRAGTIAGGVLILFASVTASLARRRGAEAAIP
ncbi:MAG TPA: DMT family transporter [Actinomycetota bacterium]|nr:DMT family transporter [Actinomycetota bacterium]